MPNEPMSIATIHHATKAWAAWFRRHECRGGVNTKISAVFRLYLDDVGVGAGTVAVRSYPIIIDRTRGQPGNIVTRRVADIQILIPRYVIDKRTARGHIQPITGRATYAAPVGGEAVGSHVGCL